ncbi:MAG: pyridoxal-phosphate dependent enzyme [Anaerolineae bacterium]
MPPPADELGRNGIWWYAALFEPPVPVGARLTLGEGDTPLVELPGLAEAVGLERLLLKREDLNPTGSHKDRGAAFQVSAHASARPDLRWLVISSSGNAAVAVGEYACAAGLGLLAFVAPSTPRDKLERLLDTGAVVFVTPKAISMAKQIAQRFDLPNLRPSTDPLAVEGFKTIGWELAGAMEGHESGGPRWPSGKGAVEALFTFASSGTSFVALGRALAGRRVESGRTWRPQCHVVQGTGAHTIAGRFDPRPVTEGRGRVGALGARKTRRLVEAVRLVESTGGSGWVVTDEEAEDALALLRERGVDTSLEGAASLAAARRAAHEHGLGSAVVLLTGRPSAGAAAGAPADEDLPRHDRLRVVRDYDEAAVAVEAALRETRGSTTPARGLADMASGSTGTAPAPSAAPAPSDVPAARSAPAPRRARRVRRVRGVEDFEAWAQGRRLSLAFAGTDPHYAIGLERLLPELRVASTVDAPVLGLLRERGVRAYVPEPGSPAGTAARSTAALLEEPGAIDFLTARAVPSPAAVDRPDGLIVFKSSHRVEQRAARHGLRLLASDASVARRWENKVAFVSIAAELELPVPTSTVLDLRRDGHADGARLLGERFVLQAPHGFGGARTALVTSPAEFELAAQRLRTPTARAARLVDGVPLTVNACVTAAGVACSAPFGQATGLPDLTPYPLGSCGNDWSWEPARRLDPSAFIDITRKIGSALRGQGYRGVFGVDFVLGDDGQPYVIEVNPRLVASIALYTQLELAAGRLPLLGRHVLAFLDQKADEANLDLHVEPVQGSQVIVHDVSGVGGAVGGALATGAFAFDGDRLRLSRPAMRVDELAGPSEVLVLAPAMGSVVSPGASYARLQLVGPALDDGGTMRPEVAAAVRAVRAVADVGQQPAAD